VDEFSRGAFLRELRHQCEFALAAYNVVQQGGDAGTVFYHVQAFLVSSANVSKILFPGAIRGTQSFKDSCHRRAEELRTLLGVEGDSVLKDRELRDHFEHFDERLQAWADRPGPKNIVDNNIIIGMPLEQAISGFDPQDIFRTYVSPPPSVRFWDNTYELHVVAEALRQLMQTAALAGAAS
jgi:hypothetical protein